MQKQYYISEMIVWCIFAFILLAMAFIFAPRKQSSIPTAQEIALQKHHKYQLFLKDEKDTKRFYEDIRALYPL